MAIKYGATRLHDSSDETKIVAFDASSIPTGTTRTLTTLEIQNVYKLLLYWLIVI